MFDKVYTVDGGDDRVARDIYSQIVYPIGEE